MSIASIEEMIRVMAAFQEGKAIQGRPLHAAHKDPNTPWEDLPLPLWNWTAIEYRIKPERLRIYLVITARGDAMAEVFTSAENAKTWMIETNANIQWHGWVVSEELTSP